MKFSQKWKQAYDKRDLDAFHDLIDDDFHFHRHRTGDELNKEGIINVWASVEPRPIIEDQEISYENDDVLIINQKMYFLSGDFVSAMIVMFLKDGKLSKMEMQTTPLSP